MKNIRKRGLIGENIDWVYSQSDRSMVPTLFEHGIATKRYLEPREYDRVLMENPELMKRPSRDELIKSFRHIRKLGIPVGDKRYRREVYKLRLPFSYYSYEYKRWLGSEKPIDLDDRKLPDVIDIGRKKRYLKSKIKCRCRK